MKQTQKIHHFPVEQKFQLLNPMKRQFSSCNYSENISAELDVCGNLKIDLKGENVFRCQSKIRMIETKKSKVYREKNVKNRHRV